MVAVCLGVILGRNQIRAWWWTQRLTASETLDEQAAYLARLVSLGEASVSAAQHLLGQGDPLLRSYGLVILQHAPGQRARGLLIAAAAHSEPSVRTEAVRGLGIRRDRDALAQIAQGGDPLAAAAATAELGRIGTAEAITLLIDLAHSHESVAVRVQAIECLGHLRAAAAIDLLTQLLDDNSVFAGYTAAERSARESIAAVHPGERVEWPPAQRTVGQCAAQALERITGSPPNQVPTTQNTGARP
jgi:HEAT repeat protein